MDGKKIWVFVFIFAFAAGAIGLALQSKKINQMERELEWVKGELRSPQVLARTVFNEEAEVDSENGEVLIPSPTEAPPMEYIENPGNIPAQEYNPTLITPETLQELQGVVQDQVKEEMAKIKRKKKDDEVSVKLIAKELELDSYTQERLTMYYNDCKDRGLDLLLAPRADGLNFMDEFARAEATGEGGKEIWGRLFTDRIPGTDQTYIQRLMEIGAETTRNIETLLTLEQIEDYGTFDIDPFKVNTGYDPFDNYTQQRNGK